MERWGERAQVIGSAGDGGVVGLGNRGGHISTIKKVDGPRSQSFGFGSETASEAG